MKSHNREIQDRQEGRRARPTCTRARALTAPRRLGETQSARKLIKGSVRELGNSEIPERSRYSGRHQASRPSPCKRDARASMNGVPISASAMTSRHTLKRNYAAWRCSPRRSRPHVAGRHIPHNRTCPLTPILAPPFRSLERFLCSRYTDIDFPR